MQAHSSDAVHQPAAPLTKAQIEEAAEALFMTDRLRDKGWLVLAAPEGGNIVWYTFTEVVDHLCRKLGVEE